MNSELWLMISFFVVVLGSTLGVGWLVINRNPGPGGEPEGDGSGLALNETTPNRSRTILARAFHTMGKAIPLGNQSDEPLRKKMLMAGYRWPTAVTIFHGIKVAVALGLAGFVGWLILFVRGDSQAVFVPALCAAGFGYLLPDRLLQRRIASRACNIRSGLSSAVDLLVLTTEAGQSLDQAMLDVAKALGSSYPELSEELLLFHLEVRAGKSREEALRSLSERSPESEMKKLVSVLLDGDRYGTSLGPALRTHGRYLRTRTRQSAQERARKLTVKMTIPTFFFIFPAVLVVTLGPAYLQLKEGLSRLIEGF